MNTGIVMRASSTVLAVVATIGTVTTARADEPRRTVLLDFSSNQDDVQLYSQRKGDSEYKLLCTSPCMVNLPAGYYHFALRRPGESLESFPRRTPLRTSMSMHAQIESNRATRTQGAAIGASVMVLGTLVMRSAFEYDSRDACIPESDCWSRSEDHPLRFVAGALLFVGGTVAALGYGSRPDKVEVSFTALPIGYKTARGMAMLARF